MFDLALAANGDLVFAANRDLAGVSGIDLIEQRIKLRLKLRRGTWLYDPERTLGSQLFRLSGASADEASTALTAYVQEALRPMASEIVVNEIRHMFDDGEVREGPDEVTAAVNRSLTVIVNYSVVDDLQPGTEGILNQQEVSIGIPLVGGGGI